MCCEPGHYLGGSSAMQPGGRYRGREAWYLTPEVWATLATKSLINLASPLYRSRSDREYKFAAPANACRTGIRGRCTCRCCELVFVLEPRTKTGCGKFRTALFQAVLNRRRGFVGVDSAACRRSVELPRLCSWPLPQGHLDIIFYVFDVFWAIAWPRKRPFICCVQYYMFYFFHLRAARGWPYAEIWIC
jgi:hypothetical protein